MFVSNAQIFERLIRYEEKGFLEKYVNNWSIRFVVKTVWRFFYRWTKKWVIQIPSSLPPTISSITLIDLNSGCHVNLKYTTKLHVPYRGLAYIPLKNECCQPRISYQQIMAADSSWQVQHLMLKVYRCTLYVLSFLLFPLPSLQNLHLHLALKNVKTIGNVK